MERVAPPVLLGNGLFMSKHGGAGVGVLTEEEQPSSMPIERSYQ
jgi:hypothetical protein